ncbi:hypothetical protein ACHAXT_006661 [Thalassiosira profunda]
MSAAHRRLSPLTALALALALVCAAGRFVSGFSSVYAPSRRIIDLQNKARAPSTTSCRYAMFEDDDCEDLCGAFGEDASPVPLNKTEDVAAANTRSIQRPRRPRRTRALWWVGNPGPNECKTCNGSGAQTCRFCGGTDFLSAIGGETDALFYEGIGKDCPVCSDGQETCTSCAGTGWVAFSWSQESNSLHP